MTPSTSAMSFSQLAGIPTVSLSDNLQFALASGERASGIAAEVLALRIGPGKLTPQEYFYYRLWDAVQEKADKLWRDNLGEMSATIRMGRLCRGTDDMPRLIDARKSQLLV